MALLDREFDATNIEPAQPRELIRPGTYSAFIKETDLKPTRKAAMDGGDDLGLNVQYEVNKGDHSGRIIYQNINYKNRNDQAQEIGQREFSSLCHAVGKLRIKDTAELHGNRVDIVVDIQPESEKDGKKYAAKNIVTEVKPYGESAAKPAASTGGSSAPAWAAKKA